MDEDFGFSFVETQELKVDNRAEELYNAISIFLENLKKNPEKDTIHWPNRVEKIEQFQKKLKEIVEVKS